MRSGVRPGLRRGGNCQIEYKLLLRAAPSPMLCEESSDRNQPDKLPGLSQCQYPAIQTPVSAGLSFCPCGNATVALRGLRVAILCAADAVSDVFVRALRTLRQLGIAAHLCRARPRRDGESRAPPRAPRVALQTLPPQVFFSKTAAPGKPLGSNCTQQVARYLPLARRRECESAWRVPACRQSAQRFAWHR